LAVSADTRRKILVINGHPDPRPERFCAALCAAYAAGARSQGWETRELQVGGLMLGDEGRNPGDDAREMSTDMADAMQAIRWTNQLVIVFPLWLDRPPPFLCRLFDELARTDVDLRPSPYHGERRTRPAHFFVTMEMPAFAHRAKCRRGASGATRSISLPGIVVDAPTFIGSVDAISDEQRKGWLRMLHASGASGS
jgi:putative NADPH-quinone reductase